MAKLSLEAQEVSWCWAVNLRWARQSGQWVEIGICAVQYADSATLYVASATLGCD